MNDREFRQHLVKLRLERERKDAQAANAAVKKPPVTAKSQKAKKKRSAQASHIANPKQRGVEMDTDDGWPKVWAEMTGEELRDRLRHYLFLAANGPNQHAKRIAQLVAEADKRGKAEMMDEALQWAKSHGPAKQEQLNQLNQFRPWPAAALPWRVPCTGNHGGSDRH